MKLPNLDQLTWDSSDAIYFFVSVATLWLGSDKRLNKNLPLGLWFEIHVFLLLLQQTAWNRISLRTYPSFTAVVLHRDLHFRDPALRMAICMWSENDLRGRAKGVYAIR